jgi:hypothetical protein
VIGITTHGLRYPLRGEPLRLRRRSIPSPPIPIYFSYKGFSTREKRRGLLPRRFVFGLPPYPVATPCLRPKKSSNLCAFTGAAKRM